MQRSFITPMLFILSLCVALSACMSSEQKVEQQVLPDEIVLIFEQPVLNYIIKLPGKSGFSRGGKHEVEYIEDNLGHRYIDLDYEADFDTLHISTKRDFVNVSIAYKGLDALDYLFQKGDTAEIVYQGSQPFVKIRNRDTRPFDYRFENFCRNEMGKDSLRPSLSRRLYKQRENGTANKYSQSQLDSLRRSEHKQVVNALDSLKSINEISAQQYAFYHAKLSFSDTWYSNIKHSANQPPISPEQVLYQRADSLLYRLGYRRHVYNICSINALDRMKKGNRNTFHTSLFDDIQRDTLLTAVEKDAALMDCFFYINLTAKQEERSRYYHKLTAHLNDSSLAKTLQHLARGLGDREKNRLMLTDLKDIGTDFQSVIAAHKGKVVYVDFWASWCKPCIASFPDAEKLKEKYKHQAVGFVYLSTDDSSPLWKKAASKYGIEKDSYQINNRFSSELFKELAVNSIPRYLIYDKTGKLVEDKAPRPGDTETIALIDRYLAE